MKSILISIKPEFVAKILNGKKAIEIRKSKPNIELPCKVYIYCTQPRQPKQDIDCVNADYLTTPHPYTKRYILGANYGKCLNGKVVAEFTLNEIETLWHNNKDKTSTATIIDVRMFEKQTCMTWEQYLEYHKCKNGKYPNSYAWHIEDLKIYDEPKLLNKFFKPCDGCNKIGSSRCTDEVISDCRAKVITRGPADWCYCQEV